MTDPTEASPPALTPPALTPQTRAAVDDLIRRTQAGSQAPSLIAGVVRGGVVAHVSGAGETPAPDRGLQYRLGSITKSLTAALVLGLRDEGRLDLDDLVTDHLADLNLSGVRLRQLLGHSSGLQREPDGLWWERHAGGDLPALVAGVSADKLAFGRYHQFHYSNLAYGLLGGVVERHAGTSWSEAVSTRLLAPLGMHRTSYQAQEPFARGYVIHPWLRTLREEPREDAGAMAPAGQLWSTVDDLAQFAAALGGHRPDVLTPATVAELAHPVALADLEAWTNGYGLGLQLWRSGERVYVGHTGSMPGYLAALVVHRRTGTGVVAFANTYSLPGFGIGRLGITLLDAVLDAEPEPTAPWHPCGPAPAEAAPLLGRWWWMGREVQAQWENDALALRMIGGPSAEVWRFAVEAPDRWRGHSGEQAGEILTVLRAPDGTAAGLDIATFIFRREPMAD